jgi:hypothetical protein
MKRLRTPGIAVLAGVLAVLGVWAQAQAPLGLQLAEAANRFLATLTPEQKAKATFAFDDKERFNWNFVPLQDKQRRATRKGIPLEELDQQQREAALELLKLATSPAGYEAARTIMSLEGILAELEKNGAMVRNPNWYFVSIFGTPDKSAKWGFRIEGHHLSLNLTLENGEVIGTTPCVFAANPATVKNGPRQGLRAIPDCDDLAQKLARSLDEEQKKLAILPKAFPEIDQKTTKAPLGEPVGIPGAKLTEEQRGILTDLIKAYTDRFAAPIAQAEYRRATANGLDQVYFAYTGGFEQGQKHTYRVHGPNFAIQFLNEQSDSAGNPANHIHSAWRRLPSDFGLAK